MRILKSAVLAFLMSVSANAQIAQPSAGTYPRAVAAGYKAALYCSGIFNAGRAPAQIDANELTGIYPDYDKIVPTLTAQINRVHGAVAVAFDPALPPRYAVWQDGRGCVTLPIGSKAPANSRSAPPPHRLRAQTPAPGRKAMPAVLRPLPRHWPSPSAKRLRMNMARAPRRSA